jgi:hypothetical protein
MALKRKSIMAQTEWLQLGSRQNLLLGRGLDAPFDNRHTVYFHTICVYKSKCFCSHTKWAFGQAFKQRSWSKYQGWYLLLLFSRIGMSWAWLFLRCFGRTSERSWMICTPYPILCGWENQDEWDGHGMWRVWGRIEVCTGCWWGSLRERDHWGDQDVGGRIILRWIFRKLGGVVGTGGSWFRTGTDGGHLWVRWGTFEFHKCGEFLD